MVRTNPFENRQNSTPGKGVSLVCKGDDGGECARHAAFFTFIIRCLCHVEAQLSRDAPIIPSMQPCANLCENYASFSGLDDGWN